MSDLPWERLRAQAAASTRLGALLVADALEAVGELPDESVDLVVTSPPYDCQGKYGNGEDYGRDWYRGFFLELTAEIHRVLRSHGSFVLNYRSKRQRGERGVLQYELVFWLREQGFVFAEDFIWGKPSPPPGRFNRFLKDAVEYCFQFAKSQRWQFFPEQCLAPARWDAAVRGIGVALTDTPARVATPEELRLCHTPGYIETARRDVESTISQLASAIASRILQPPANSSRLSNPPREVQ